MALDVSTKEYVKRERYFVLNPKKGLRFITKGINLNAMSPVGAVPPDLDEEFMAKIRQGLKDGLIFEIHPDQAQKISLKGQAEVDKPEESEERVAGAYGTQYNTRFNEDLQRHEKRAQSHVINMPDEDGKVAEDEEGKPRSSIILTDIESEHDED